MAAATFAMDQLVTISRAAGATDAEGRPSAAVTVTTVQGMVAELAAAERPQGGALGEETTAQALLPLGTDVQAHDTLTVAHASGTSSAFRVVAVHDTIDTLLVDLHRDG